MHSDTRIHVQLQNRYMPNCLSKAVLHGMRITGAKAPIRCYGEPFCGEKHKTVKINIRPIDH